MLASRLRRLLRDMRTQVFRPKLLSALAIVTLVSVWLLWLARDVPQFPDNMALNVGADLIGVIVTIFVVTPLITRAQRGRIREHSVLDYDAYTDHVRGATSVVRILDTFSNLLDRPQTRLYLRALREALGRQTVVQILLLDPNSPAAELRAEELQNSNVRREILRNLRVLHEFSMRLDERSRERFDVRLYSTAASITVYRWDDRALIAFLSLGRLSGQGAQLEISTDSPLGHFVEQRFDELWRHATKLSDFMRMSMSVGDGHGGPARDFSVPFVLADGHYYLSDQQVVAHLARAHAAGTAVQATVAQRAGMKFHLEIVDDDASLREALVDHFMEKYNVAGQVFVCLKPLAHES